MHATAKSLNAEGLSLLILEVLSDNTLESSGIVHRGMTVHLS